MLCNYEAEETNLEQGVLRFLTKEFGLCIKTNFLRDWDKYQLSGRHSRALIPKGVP